ILENRTRSSLCGTDQPYASLPKTHKVQAAYRDSCRCATSPEGNRPPGGIESGPVNNLPYKPSFTRINRSAFTFFSSWTMPEGQRISINSAVRLLPRPKCTGPALEEA